MSGSNNTWRYELATMQRDAYAGDLTSLLVARDLQQEQGLPVLSPAEEMGLHKIRCLPILRRSSIVRRVVARRDVKGAYTQEERTELQQLLHDQREALGECYAHPWRSSVTEHYKGWCACWSTKRVESQLGMPHLEWGDGTVPGLPIGEEGARQWSQLTVVAPFKIRRFFITESVPGATRITQIRVNGAPQMPAVTVSNGGVPSAAFGTNSPGAMLPFDTLLPGTIEFDVTFDRPSQWYAAFLGWMVQGQEDGRTFSFFDWAGPREGSILLQYAGVRLPDADGALARLRQSQR